MSEAQETQERIDLHTIRPKMQFEGRVTSLELYGAFVDIGAERDGLVHVSQIREERVNRVADVLEEGDVVTVWVRDVDPERGRIDLTMIEPPEHSIDDLEPDQVLVGKVTKLAPYGAFVDIGVGRDGLVHISEMAEGHTDKPSEVVQVGDEIEVRVVRVDQKRRRIELSLLGIAEDEAEVNAEEEQQEEPLTAMEMAWRDAMKRQGMSLDVPTRDRSRRRRRSEIRRQQAAIIARTLKNKKD
jgi:small subunit ribosomal protein S1